MKIDKDSVVEIDYTLRGDDGGVIDTSDGDEPLMYLHGSGQIVPGLENALLGRGAGEHFKIDVSPEDGYGEKMADRAMTVPRSALPEGHEPEIGMELEAVGPRQERVVLWISAVGPDSVTLDANHPLAGQTLHFDVTVRTVRVATADELTHGHAHGPDDHHHH